VSGGAPTFNHDVLIAGLLPNTVYHFGVTSTDSFAQVSTLDNFTFLTGSATSPVIDFWYTSALPGGGVGRRFGHLGAAQAFGNVTGSVIDPDGFISSATYTVRLGTTVIESGPLVRGPDTRRLLKSGDFNVELQMAQLVAGTYTVTVSATDNNGNVSTEVIPVEITKNVVWPFGTVQFTGATPLQEQVRPVDGEWTVSNAGARTKSSATGYDRLLTLGDLSWTNYEVFGSFVVHSIEAPGTFPSVSGNPLVGIGVRWYGHAGNAVPRNGSWPTGAFAWFLWNADHVTGRFRLHTNFYTNNVSQTAPMVLGDRYFYRVRVTQNGAVPQYVYSIWKTEVFTPGAPPSWEVTTPGVVGDPASGAVVLIAHHVDATFGDVTVTPLGQ